MNKKGVVNIILIVLVVVLAGALGYVVLFKKSASPQNTTTSTTAEAQSKTIEKMDFKKYLVQKYESVNPQLGDSCEAGSTNVQDVFYGDLTGDGVEEAVVNYRTCQDGTGGGNSEVYTIDSKGDLVNITPDSTKLAQADYKKFYNGFAGHGSFGIDKPKLIFSFPVYKSDDPNCCPTGGKSTITFNWDGSKFVYNEIATDPSIN